MPGRRPAALRKMSNRVPSLQSLKSPFWAILVSLCLASQVAAGALDGRIFDGMIGPRSNPDLEDSLHFSDGYFWSDICTRCGFVPGPYSAQSTPEGIRFEGVLRSDSRGSFTYDGFVLEDGSIDVSIKWERKRWYWTTRREIAFKGLDQRGKSAMPLADIRALMMEIDADGNPLCARF